ncbi:O-antigen ligase family protein [Paenibacillus pinistramenti]|uniref:O-antigen ligase family protein n=1 Tax=Paenibacillus pinistramenti TaxID=1768003 RepID=UPI001109FA16|nr:O-antigen ligase family protein [Paenibacillus pinistramenti]
MSTEVIFIGALLLSMLVFLAQSVLHLGLKLDPALLFGLCLYFDMVGFFYKKVMPGNALVILVGLPLILVLIIVLQRPLRPLGMLDNEGLWLWAAFFGYCILSFSWSPQQSGGLSKLLLLFAHGVVPGLYTYIFYKKYKTFSWSFAALFGLAYAVVHLTFGVYSAEYPGRLTLPGDNPIFNARISLMTVTVCLWGRGIPLWLRLAAGGTAIVSAIQTQSRGPLAFFLLANLLIAGWIVYRELRTKGGRSRQLSKWLKVLAAAGIIAGAFGFVMKDTLLEAVESSRFSVLIDTNQLQGDDNYLGRVGLQLDALQTFTEHPFFGVGLGGHTPPVTDEFPHNVLLEMAGELGIAGLFLWLAAFLYTVYAAREHPVLLVLLLQSLGSALVSGDFGYNFEYVFIAMVVLAFKPKREYEGAAIYEESPLSYHRSRLRRS